MANTSAQGCVKSYFPYQKSRPAVCMASSKGYFLPLEGFLHSPIIGAQARSVGPESGPQDLKEINRCVMETQDVFIAHPQTAFRFAVFKNRYYYYY